MLLRHATYYILYITLLSYVCTRVTNSYFWAWNQLFPFLEPKFSTEDNMRP